MATRFDLRSSLRLALEDPSPSAPLWSDTALNEFLTQALRNYGARFPQELTIAVDVKADATTIPLATDLTLRDSFARPDTAVGLGIADSGRPWINTQGAKIAAERYVANFAGAGSVYARLDCGATVVRQSARFSFNGAAAETGLTLISSHGAGGDLSFQGAFNNMAHFVVTPTAWVFTTWQAGVSSPNLGFGNFTLATDGTAYDVAVTYDLANSLAIVELPDGTISSIQDPSIALVIGRWVAYQILLGAADSRLHGYESVAAAAVSPTAVQVRHVADPAGAIVPPADYPRAPGTGTFAQEWHQDGDLVKLERPAPSTQSQAGTWFVDLLAGRELPANDVDQAPIIAGDEPIVLALAESAALSRRVIEDGKRGSRSLDLARRSLDAADRAERLIVDRRRSVRSGVLS